MIEVIMPVDNAKDSTKPSIEIHQFARGFDVVTKNGQYVSGGYRGQVAFFSATVPLEIQERCLGVLNNNFPPEEGSIAVLAWDLEKYAVLSIANKQTDDGNRPTIGYRYFWLDKQKANHVMSTESTEIDGIFALLLAWHYQEYPIFKIEDIAQGNSYECLSIEVDNLTYYQEDYQQKYKTQTNCNVVDFLEETERRSGFDMWLVLVKIHFSGQHISSHEKIRNIWAYNATRFSKADSYTRIVFANERDKNEYEYESTSRLADNQTGSVGSPNQPASTSQHADRIKSLMQSVASTEQLNYKKDDIKELLEKLSSDPQYNSEATLEKYFDMTMLSNIKNGDEGIVGSFDPLLYESLCFLLFPIHEYNSGWIQSKFLTSLEVVTDKWSFSSQKSYRLNSRILSFYQEIYNTTRELYNDNGKDHKEIARLMILIEASLRITVTELISFMLVDCNKSEFKKNRLPVEILLLLDSNNNVFKHVFSHYSQQLLKWFSQSQTSTVQKDLIRSDEEIVWDRSMKELEQKTSMKLQSKLMNNLLNQDAKDVQERVQFAHKLCVTSVPQQTIENTSQI
jgi:hypothetical protein